VDDAAAELGCRGAVNARALFQQPVAEGFDHRIVLKTLQGVGRDVRALEFEDEARDDVLGQGSRTIDLLANRACQVGIRPRDLLVFRRARTATETPMLMREAIEDGNKMQFMDPPQMPGEVGKVVLRALDKPRLELFVRAGESWNARLAMLMPNLLVRLIPPFGRKSESGHRLYLASLARRGLIRRRGSAWELTPPEK